MTRTIFNAANPVCILIIAVLFGSWEKKLFTSGLMYDDKDNNATYVQLLADSILQNGYEVEKSLPAGYVKDGTVDYTSYIQAAIIKYPALVFPAFPVLVNDKGLVIGSNKKILFPSGSVIVLKPSSKPNYNILCVYQASNVTLINPVIKGDRSAHTGSGVWGMGLAVYSGKNVNITSPQVIDCWGDGIYIAKADNDVPSSNITITNSYCKNNRRNALTIISVDGLRLISPFCSNSDGTLPMDGIDIEPNDNEDVVNNIVITDPRTENNKGEGIQISLSNLQGPKPKKVNIKIDNHVDRSSSIGMLVSCFTKAGSTSNVSGTISLSNPIWLNNSEVSLRATWLREPNLTLSISKPNIIDTNKPLLNSDQLKNLLAKAVDKKTNIKLSLE